jgi:mRNA-degrading endonuclease toxin of MazEF toxin-antitoxin module
MASWDTDQRRQPGSVDHFRYRLRPYRNQLLTCDVISTDPGGPPLTVRLDESDPVAGWVIGPQIASTFKGYLAERLGEAHTNTMMQMDAVLRAVLRLP